MLKSPIFKVEDLEQDTLDQAAALLIQAWQDFAHNSELCEYDRFENSDPVKWVSNYLAEGGHGFVALDGEKVVGVITCKIGPSPGYFRDSIQLFINDVAVDGNYRRQGIAETLELRCEQYAKENDVNLIIGEIYAYNHGSRALVKKLGRTMGYETWYKRLKN